MKKRIRLGVNIDHVATLREARKEGLPDLVAAAKEVIAAGADGLVCHLREDRRHIQDEDVFALRKLPTRLDLEMAATPEMLKIALAVKPNLVTLVPEKRQELTTEGGLDVIRGFRKMFPIVRQLQRAGIIVSLFIEPSTDDILAAQAVGADYVELHTGKYANKPKNLAHELLRLKLAAKLAEEIGIKVNAGHGLNLSNTLPIAHLPQVEELNIGFSIIARATFIGLKAAVIEMVNLLKLARN